MNKIKKLIFLGLLFEIIVLVISFFEAEGSLTHFFQAAARLSGRVSLLFFAILLIFSTINQGFEKETLYKKYILARNFAILHIIHWFLLATAVKLSGFELAIPRVLGGALAYLMVVLLPFILKGKIFTKISLKWTMHIYLTYVWFIFFMTYITRVTGKATNITGSMASYWVLILITLALMFWRIFRQFISPKRASLKRD